MNIDYQTLDRKTRIQFLNIFCFLVNNYLQKIQEKSINPSIDMEFVMSKFFYILKLSLFENNPISDGNYITDFEKNTDFKDISYIDDILSIFYEYTAVEFESLNKLFKVYFKFYNV